MPGLRTVPRPPASITNCTYTLADAAQRPLVDDYLARAFIPALNRLGLRPIGVFHEQKPSNEPRVYVVIPYASLEQALTTGDRLLADAQHARDGAAYLNVEAPARAYERIESSLLVAFVGMPKLETPKQAGQPHLMQLRIYESHSEVAGKKKVEMFNQGEIDIFKRVGLTPVFFGETLVGARRPNLTYLLVFDDQAALDKAWATFRTDPAWLKLKAIPEYADKRIVSKITNLVLAPAPFSQI
jgi:hypothetical protein